MQPLELTLRSQVGVALGTAELDQLAARVEELLQHPKEYEERIGHVLADTISNFGSSAGVGASYIISRLKERQQHGR